METEYLKQALQTMYSSALRAVDPEKAVESFLRGPECSFDRYRKVFVVGMGKAGVPMARAIEKSLGERLSGGVIIVKEGHGGTLEKTKVYEAGHPEPDQRGQEAAQAVLEFLKENLTADDLLLVVISGGGSALFASPVPEIDLSAKIEATSVLIRCGATIQEINTIRKHISQVKGGRLLDFTQGAEVLSLVLSDVVGDDFASIASGPTTGDPTTFQDCLQIVRKYDISRALPGVVIEYLERGLLGGKNAPLETPKPADSRFQRVRNRLVANNFSALQAAAREAQRLGLQPLILSSSMAGNTEDVAAVHVAIAKEVLASGNPVARPCCLISGGETTVQVRGNGKGGRNMEFVLHCGQLTRDWACSPVLFASIGSDGTDGPTDAAGALATQETFRRAQAKGMDLSHYLERNDSYHFFKGLGDLIKTGPTLTNVMDLRFVLIG